VRGGVEVTLRLSRGFSGLSWPHRGGQNESGHVSNTKCANDYPYKLRPPKQFF
jgi:hypothetical protein